jgi:two-component system sensor histidine kinase VicK
MSSQLDGVAARFEELRARLEGVAGDDTVVADMLAQLTEAVIRQAELIDAILDQLPVGVIVLDPSYRVTRFNQRAREIAGGLVTSTAPMGDWLVDLYHLDGTPLEFGERPSVRALRGEASEDVVYEVREPGRDPFVLKGSSTPIRDDTGELIFAVSVFEDITETQRREQADRDFVANAAHQIRTPIAAMMSASQALQAGAKNEPEMRDRFLGHIDRELARMRMLADGLLALARAERGDLAPMLSPIKLKPVLERVIEHSANKDGVELELVCPEEVIACTNEALVSEALANVVTNGVQHTIRGTVTVRVAQQPETATVEVWDEGPGISGQARARVFERFYRGPRPAEAGVGLGLAIAAAATHAAGGALELVDTPAGTCFRFTFRREVAGR